MNLFRQQKFSIRKFNVGIFSALIATVTFISTNPTTASAAEQNQPAQNQPAQPADANTQPNANAGAQANPTAQPAAPANQGQPAVQPANQGGQANPAGGAAQPNTQPAGQGNQADPNNAAQAQPGNQATPANQAGQGNNQATPNNNATPANQTQPANAPAAAQPAAPVAANAQTQDPNASNTGEGSINTTLTFDDPAISTDENRQDPTVTVTDKVNGYSLINNGKIGFVNSELRRSDMFDKNNPQNYQAKGNVAALGRVNANDSTDHGNFNGISKTVNVKPDSELIINFTTMQTNSKQGATNLVIKDAKKNTELATVNVAKTGTAHLFKVPTDADRLDLQFIPDNTAVADASRITTNKDGYKYYSFIDNVGLFSGSHLYVKNRDLAPKATNNKEYTINTEIGNNGNFGASLKADQFKYEVTLPQGVTYVNNSLTTTFPNGNEDSTVLKNMTVNYDQNANKVTFTSQGVTTARGTHTKEVLFPDKSLKLSYKVNVANIDTPKNIDFNEKLTYRTASDVVINNAQPEVTLTADPFSVAVEMNKDALQQQVNSQVDNSHYTTASIAEYNKLKQQADTILNEDANHVKTANRASQADIDGLVTKLQAALIDNQAAIAELDTKAQEKVTAAQQSKKVTQDEVAALVTKINNDKNNAIAEINKQTTAQGVTTEKDNGIAVLEQDVITPTVKPKANQAIEVKAEDTKESIDQSDQLTAEEKTEALAMIKQITDQAKQGITDATTTAEVEKAKAQGLEAFDNIQIDSTEKQKAIEELETALDQIEAGVNVNADATTEEKEAFTNALEDILSKATEDISDQTTNAEIATVKNSALEQLKAQRINPEVKKNALEAIREVVNKQIEIIKNADADASAKEIARTDLGRYFDRFADKLDKTQTNAEVAELQNVTIPAIEAIVPQNDPDANDTNNGIDNNDATANSNANATPENTGQPNVSETTANGKADASPTTPNNSDAATGETTATSATDDANDKPQANNNSSVDASTNSPTMDNDVTSKPEVESTNNGTTDKPVTETDNATPAESTTNNNSTTTATKENAPTGSTATAPTTASTEAASSADSKDNASVNDSKQNAEVNNSAESQSTNDKVAQPKSENKAKAEKDGSDSTNQSMVESTTETLPSADITEPNVPSNTSKDKEESTTNQTDAGQLKSETNVASNEADKSPSKADTEVSNKPSTSASSEAKEKMTSTNVSQKDDTATADTNDTQKSVGSAANNKATQNDGANASPATVSNGSNSANQDMLNVTNTDDHQAKTKSAQQGKVNKAKQQAKTLPDTGMSHNDDLPYAELALGAGMAFLIRRFTKKDQQTEE
ncbi:SasC/FmtB family protein [Staphylococcus aureus]|uniref:SasC/FmtB family protein n=1 Tax=Staphylococcus aureus TaxID=1280 RepID=UPI000D596DFD|nr:SasC/FmtB family protein [Staphylococcus aureus]